MGFLQGLFGRNMHWFFPFSCSFQTALSTHSTRTHYFTHERHGCVYLTDTLYDSISVVCNLLLTYRSALRSSHHLGRITNLFLGAFRVLWPPLVGFLSAVCLTTVLVSMSLCVSQVDLYGAMWKNIVQSKEPSFCSSDRVFKRP